MKLIRYLEKQSATWFLVLVSFLFFLLRLPSLFEPYWYGDEGIYQVIGMALRQGRHLYSGIWDNKPPLLYYIYAIFNGNQSSVRFFSLLSGLGAIIIFFFLAKKLFQKQKTVYITTSIFAFLFATPFLEGNIANAENFMLLPILGAALLIIRQTKTQPLLPPMEGTKGWILFSAGILLGLSFLVKIVALFDFAAFFVFLFFISYTNIRSLRSQIRPLFFFCFGFFIPIVFTFLFFLIQGDLKMFITSAFFSNVGYVEYGNRFFIPHGFLIFKLLLLTIVVLFLFCKRRSFPQSHVFILLWLAFSLFDTFFSQRPYTHYILMSIISFSLLIGLCIQQIKQKYLYILAAFLVIWMINAEFSLHNRLPKNMTGYYSNFLAFTFQQKSTLDYFRFFDNVTPQDYAVASYITLHAKKDDGIFLWGNSAQIYKLTNTLPPGRFIVAYHITGSSENIEETRKAITAHQPKFIIISGKESRIPYTLQDYEPKITLDNTTIYEKVF